MRKIILSKINSLGIKFSNYLKISYIPFLPTHLDIEPINICNFKCKHCKVTYWKKEKEILSVEKFIAILEQFPYLKSVKLQGLGEPLLNNNLDQMIIEARNRDIYIEFFTNGSVYNERIWNVVNETEKISVKFSIDAGSKEKFEEKYSFWSVISKKNINELEKIILLANNLGINDVHFQIFLSDWKDPIVEEYINDLKVNNDNYFVRKIADAEKIAQDRGINLQIYKGNFLTQKNKCSWPFTSAFISANGDVVPCCVISDSSVIKMGNIFKKSFINIWNSNEYKDFRKRIRTHNLYDFCRSCYGEK